LGGSGLKRGDGLTKQFGVACVSSSQALLGAVSWQAELRLDLGGPKLQPSNQSGRYR
jgi:hypothetical protein